LKQNVLIAIAVGLVVLMGVAVALFILLPMEDESSQPSEDSAALTEETRDRDPEATAPEAVPESSEPEDTAELPVIPSEPTPEPAWELDMQAVVSIIGNRTDQVNVSVAIADLTEGKTFATSNAVSFFVASGFYVPLYIAVGGANANESLKQTAVTMLNTMNNQAANTIIDSLGGIASVNSILWEKGFPQTQFERKFGDVAASNAGSENYTTAQEAIRLMQLLYADGGYVEMNADLGRDGITLPSADGVYAHSGQGIGTSYNVFVIVENANTQYAVCILTQGTGATAAAAKANSVPIITALLDNIHNQMVSK
jgi:hypothetical protein